MMKIARLLVTTKIGHDTLAIIEGGHIGCTKYAGGDFHLELTIVTREAEV